MEENNTTQNEKIKKDTSKKKEKEKGPSLKDWFLDIKGEYGKIIWPKREELLKQTVTVIFTSAIVGAVILAMDGIFAQAYQLFVQAIIK